MFVCFFSCGHICCLMSLVLVLDTNWLCYWHLSAFFHDFYKSSIFPICIFIGSALVLCVAYTAGFLFTVSAAGLLHAACELIKTSACTTGDFCFWLSVEFVSADYTKPNLPNVQLVTSDLYHSAVACTSTPSSNSYKHISWGNFTRSIFEKRRLR